MLEHVRTSTKSNNIKLVLTSMFCVVFLIFFIFYISAKLAHPDRLTSIDDPYFHARYAALLASGHEPVMPYASSMSWWGGGSLYYGYHQILAKAITLTGGDVSDERLMYTIKITHAFFAALFFAVFSTTIYTLLSVYFPTYTLRSLVSLSLLTTFLLPIVFPGLLSRLSFERPFVLATTIVWGITFALIRKHHLLLFILGILFPLVYSFTIIALIPITVYVCIGMYAQGRILWREYAIPALSVFAGLVTGVFLHPNPMHYVFNAYAVHLAVLYNSIFGTMPVGAEITPRLFTVLDYTWVLFMSALIVFGIRYFKHEHRMSHAVLLYLITLSLVYLPLQILFNRTVEYSGPVIMTATLLLLATLYEQYPLLRVRLQKIFFSHTTRFQRGILVSAVCLYVGVASGVLTHRVYQGSSNNDITPIKEMHNEIRNIAHAGDRVVVTPFHAYPTAYFLNPTLSYNQGMDPTFTLVASSSMFWMLHHAVTNPTTICGSATCSKNEIDIYTVVHDVYKARFLVVLYATNPTPADNAPDRPLELFRKSVITIIKHFGADDISTSRGLTPYASFLGVVKEDSRFRLLYMNMQSNKTYAAFEVLDK